MNNKVKKNLKSKKTRDYSALWLWLATIIPLAVLGLIGFYSLRKEIRENKQMTEEATLAEATDTEIQRDIEDQLVWDSRVTSDDITVEVTGGEVTLTGTVDSFNEKSAAGENSLDVAGVVSVDNELMIDFPDTDGLPDDETINSRVDNILDWNTELEAFDIDVVVDAGTVNLEGTVDSLWRKTYTSELIYNLTGVYDVENNLTVVPTEDISDELIANDIIEALERDVTIDEEDINVQVQNGNVVLSGKVPTVSQMAEAEDEAFFVPGVIGVDNQLELSN